MNTKNNTVQSRFDTLKWLIVLAIIVGGIGGYYYFSEVPLLYRVIGLVGLAVVAGFIALQTTKGHFAWALMKEARVEMRKVVWPTRQETSRTTIVVIIVVAVAAVILYGFDLLLGLGISNLIGK